MPAGDQDSQAWRDAIDVLLTGAYHTVDLAGRRMVAQGLGGSIVLTSSVAGMKRFGSSLAASGPGLMGYVAAYDCSVHGHSARAPVPTSSGQG